MYNLRLYLYYILKYQFNTCIICDKNYYNIYVNIYNIKKNNVVCHKCNKYEYLINNIYLCYSCKKSMIDNINIIRNICINTTDNIIITILQTYLINDIINIIYTY